MRKRAFIVTCIFLIAILSVSLWAQSAPPPLEPTAHCSSWTRFSVENNTTYAIRDNTTYVRNCRNLTYVSFCVANEMQIDYNTSNRYWTIDCSTTDICIGWTRYYPENQRNSTFGAPANSTLVCSNTTYVSWCIRDHDKVDYRIPRRYSDFNCTLNAPTCDYKNISVHRRIEQQNAYCRPCADTTLRYYCNSTTGRISWGESHLESTCQDWVVCAQAYSNESFSSIPVTKTPADLGLVGGAVVVGLAVTAGLVLFLGRNKSSG